MHAGTSRNDGPSRARRRGNDARPPALRAGVESKYGSGYATTSEHYPATRSRLSTQSIMVCKVPPHRSAVPEATRRRLT